MSKISSDDLLFVTVFCFGVQLLKVKLTGFSTAAALLGHMRTLLEEHRGELLTLEFRNATQGWSHKAPYLFAA